MNEEREILKIGGTYESHPSGRLIARDPIFSKDTGEVTGTTETEIANHTPKVITIRVLDDGVERVETIVCRVLRDYQLSEEIYLTTKDILSQNPNVKFGAACRISIGRGTKARYVEAIQIQCENIPHSVLYQHTGYRKIGDKLVFLNGTYSVSADGLTDEYSVELPEQLSGFRFINEKDPNRYDTLLAMFDNDFPAPQELMFSGVAMSFLSALNGLLREVKHEPRFILYFIGKTGSCKTSMANFFLNFFGEFSFNSAATSNFSSTGNANEKLYAITDSVLMLLDDRIPSTTANIKARMETMEQSIARNIGDRAARLRMNADSSHKIAYRPKCNLIITAEEAYSNVGESAIARSISIDLKPGDVRLDGKNSMVDMYRSAPHLNQCMSEFIQYVIRNWDDLKNRVVELFNAINPQSRSGGHGRLAETITYLEIAIVIMCEWLQAIEVIDSVKAKSIRDKAWDIFRKLSDNQNRKIVEETPVRLFLNAVKAMLDRNSIKVVRIGQDSDYTAPSKVGFRDENYYYFDPQGIYVKVKEFYALQDRTFPLSQSALFSHLANDKLIEVDVAKDGKTQSTKAKRIKGVAEGRKVRYLWLRASALDDEKEDS